MSIANNIINGFAQLKFEALDEIAVTNRLETKFMLREEHLQQLLEELSNNYSVIVFGEDLVTGYSTLYYDTPGFDLYLAHHNKREVRYKVRERTYLKNNKIFLEVKYTRGTDRIIKARLKRVDGNKPWQNRELDFLTSNFPQDTNVLVPAIWSNYRRITLVNVQNGERVTIDMDLEFSMNNASRRLDSFVIVELKQAHRTRSGAFNALKKMGYRPVSLSKYCLGINYLYPALKKNNFKPRLTAVKQLSHGAIIDTIA